MTSETSALSPREYADMHKRAFRAAFDFLNAHFPPVNTPEWWEQTARDVSCVFNQYGQTKILNEMLCGIYSYLEEEAKTRDKERENINHEI